MYDNKSPLANTRDENYSNSFPIKLALAVTLLGVISCLYIYGRGLNGPPIRSDGFGYYAYLPSVFIDHNLSFRLAAQNIVPPDASLQYNFGIGIHPLTGKMFNKYTIGTAILWTPSFLIADSFVKFFDLPRTGYSSSYQIASIASGIFYLCFGFIITFVVIRKKFGSKVALLTILLVTFATNVFHYGTYDASFSHIYSFAAMSVYILLLVNYRDSSLSCCLWQPIVIGLMLALITMIRVPNLIVGLLAMGIILERNSKVNDHKKIYMSFCFFLLAFALGMLPLLSYWCYTGGSLISNSYQVIPLPDGSFERFYWGNPQVANFLFSIQKGLFFWSPTIFFSFLALTIFFKTDRLFGVLVAIVLCLHIYVCSSWWSWSFGGSFGSRPFVDMMPIVALPLASGVCYVKKFFSDVTIWTLATILIVTNLTLMLAYWHGYIPFDGTTVEHLMKLPRLWCCCN